MVKEGRDCTRLSNEGPDFIGSQRHFLNVHWKDPAVNQTE